MGHSKTFTMLSVDRSLPTRSRFVNLATLWLRSLPSFHLTRLRY